MEFRRRRQGMYVDSTFAPLVADTPEDALRIAKAWLRASAKMEPRGMAEYVADDGTRIIANIHGESHIIRPESPR